MIPKNQDKTIDIENFFNMNVGNWLTQKTSYNPNSKIHTTKTTKSAIKEINNETNIAHLLKNIKNDNSFEKRPIKAYSISSTQNNIPVSSTLTYTCQLGSKSHGVVYKIDNTNSSINVKGNFQLFEGVLKVLINKGALSIEETIWFINENLKLTKSITKRQGQCVLISFISEIKVRSDE